MSVPFHLSDHLSYMLRHPPLREVTVWSRMVYRVPDPWVSLSRLVALAAQLFSFQKIFIKKKPKNKKRTYFFLLYFRKSSLLQTLLQFQPILSILKHISSHHNTVHELGKIFSNLKGKPSDSRL